MDQFSRNEDGQAGLIGQKGHGYIIHINYLQKRKIINKSYYTDTDLLTGKY